MALPEPAATTTINSVANYKMALDGLPIQKLAHLLREKEDDSDSDGENEVAKEFYQTPGSIGVKKQSNANTTSSGKDGNKLKTEDKNIWEEDEASHDNFDDRDLDQRPTPEYDILFKQKVTTDDVFLGMSGKNTSTACCEDLSIKIVLPETKREEIDLDVQDTFLDCRSPKYRLALHLPNKVDSKKGKADWDSNKYTLTVTLPLNREFDFMNK